MNNTKWHKFPEENPPRTFEYIIALELPDSGCGVVTKGIWYEPFDVGFYRRPGKWVVEDYFSTNGINPQDVDKSVKAWTYFPEFPTEFSKDKNYEN